VCPAVFTLATQRGRQRESGQATPVDTAGRKVCSAARCGCVGAGGGDVYWVGDVVVQRVFGRKTWMATGAGRDWGQQWRRQRKYIRKGISRTKTAWRARVGPLWSCCCAGAPRLVVVLMRSEYSRFGLLLANGR
jgi:hypothetical protein